MFLQMHTPLFYCRKTEITEWQLMHLKKEKFVAYTHTCSNRSPGYSFILQCSKGYKESVLHIWKFKHSFSHSFCRIQFTL